MESIKMLPQLIDAGKYYFQMQRYLEYFNKEQIKIICIEDLNNSPNNYKQIFEFIGLTKYMPFKLKARNVTNNKYIVPKYLDFSRKNNFIRRITGGYHSEGIFINRFYNFMKLFSRNKM